MLELFPGPICTNHTSSYIQFYNGTESAVQAFDTVFNDSRPWRINIHKTIPRAIAAIARAAAIKIRHHKTQSAF